MPDCQSPLGDWCQSRVLRCRAVPDAGLCRTRGCAGRGAAPPGAASAARASSAVRQCGVLRRGRGAASAAVAGGDTDAAPGPRTPPDAGRPRIPGAVFGVVGASRRGEPCSPGPATLCAPPSRTRGQGSSNCAAPNPLRRPLSLAAPPSTPPPSRARSEAHCKLQLERLCSSRAPQGAGSPARLRLLKPLSCKAALLVCSCSSRSAPAWPFSRSGPRASPQFCSPGLGPARAPASRRGSVARAHPSLPRRTHRRSAAALAPCSRVRPMFPCASAIRIRSAHARACPRAALLMHGAAAPSRRLCSSAAPTIRTELRGLLRCTRRRPSATPPISLRSHLRTASATEAARASGPLSGLGGVTAAQTSSCILAPAGLARVQNLAFTSSGRFAYDTIK